jgi:hypothetical protein
MGEQDIQVFDSSSRVVVDTFAGRIHIGWNHNAAVTPMGQLPFFIESMKASGLYYSFQEDCPLCYTSPNAPNIKDVLGIIVLSILAGIIQASSPTW